MEAIEQRLVLLDFAALLGYSHDSRDACVAEVLDALAARMRLESGGGGGFWRVEASSPSTVFHAELLARAEAEAPLRDATALQTFLRVWRHSVVHAATHGAEGDAERWAALRAAPLQLAACADDARLRECMTRLRLAREPPRTGLSPLRAAARGGAPAARTPRALCAEHMAPTGLPRVALAPRGALRAPCDASHDVSRAARRRGMRYAAAASLISATARLNIVV
jgi:hypothetical protein